MPDRENFVTTQSVISLIGGLYLATSLAVVSSVLFLLTSLDRVAEVDRANQVEIALKVETRHLRIFAVDYSYWDEAYENLIIDLDEVWLDDEVGKYLLDEHGADFSLAIKADRQLSYLRTSDATAGLEFRQLMSGGLADLIEVSLGDEDEGTVAGYAIAGSDLYLVVLSPFRNEKTGEIRSGSYLSFGKRLDAEYIRKLASVYEIPGLRLASETEQVENDKVLMDATGQRVGRLTWPLERPSRAIAPKVIGIVIPFFSLSLLLTRYFIKRDYADRIAFEERLYKEATCDPLTNISNRRHFMALGEQEMAIHRRNGKALAVALFDIDRFKAINDTYGHAIGDKALLHVTQICADELRKSDIFGRIGGDEFAVILRETSLEQAVEIVDRVRQKLEKSPMMAGHHFIAIALSMGVTSMNDCTTFDEVLELADVALYQAKKRGRNQVSANR